MKSDESQYQRAEFIEATIIERLQDKGYEQDDTNPNRQINRERRTAYTILNANVLCVDEDPKNNIRYGVCPSQIERSLKIKNFLDQNLKKYDQLIYIGHSRRGLGFGLGPFYGTEHTFDPSFFNPVEVGRLKKVIIASCDSERYYKTKVSKKTGIEFVGTVGSKFWIRDLLPMILRHLQ